MPASSPCRTRTLPRALCDMTQEVCERHGLPAYEISNHARPGAECRHNLVYWRYGEYAGVGPGAHGRLVDRHRPLRTFDRTAAGSMARPRRDRRAMASSRASACRAEAEGDEFLLMGLRLREGIDPERFTRLSGRTIDDLPPAPSSRAEGMIEITDDNRIRVTREGFPVLDAIVADLAALERSLRAERDRSIRRRFRRRSTRGSLTTVARPRRPEAPRCRAGWSHPGGSGTGHPSRSRRRHW